MSAVQILILVILFVGAVYVAVCYIFARMTLNPSRQPVSVSPADYAENGSCVGFAPLPWFAVPTAGAMPHPLQASMGERRSATNI